MTDDVSGSPARAPSRRGFAFFAWVTLLVIVGIAVVARVFFLTTFRVASPEMFPSLFPGERVVIRKHAYGSNPPARGDVVAFPSPGDPANETIARVIALPGEVVTIQGGAVFINGWRIPTCVAGTGTIEIDGKERAGVVVVELLDDTAYLVVHDQAALQEREHAHEGETPDHEHGSNSEGPFTVSDNEVFVLGDNRENSTDSRHWFEGRGGGVRIDRIHGRASHILFGSPQAGAGNQPRMGQPLGSPQCPAKLPQATCEAVARCLSNRPDRAITTPPSGSAASPVSSAVATPPP